MDRNSSHPPPILQWYESKGDYTITITSEEDNSSYSRTFHVHQSVLATKNDYFKVIVETEAFAECQSSSSSLQFPSKVVGHFHLFLEFLYSDNFFAKWPLLEAEQAAVLGYFMDYFLVHDCYWEEFTKYFRNLLGNEGIGLDEGDHEKTADCFEAYVKYPSPVVRSILVDYAQETGCLRKTLVLSVIDTSLFLEILQKGVFTSFHDRLLCDFCDFHKSEIDASTFLLLASQVQPSNERWALHCLSLVHDFQSRYEEATAASGSLSESSLQTLCILPALSSVEDRFLKQLPSTWWQISDQYKPFVVAKSAQGDFAAYSKKTTKVIKPCLQEIFERLVLGRELMEPSELLNRDQYHSDFYSSQLLKSLIHIARESAKIDVEEVSENATREDLVNLFLRAVRMAKKKNNSEAKEGKTFSRLKIPIPSEAPLKFFPTRVPLKLVFSRVPLASNNKLTGTYFCEGDYYVKREVMRKVKHGPQYCRPIARMEKPNGRTSLFLFQDLILCRSTVYQSSRPIDLNGCPPIQGWTLEAAGLRSVTISL